MFTTIEQVKELTGADVSQETIVMAQNIIESYVGRDEIEVTGGNDRALLGKATAYQCAYMHGDEAKIFEQAAVAQLGQFGQVVTLRDDGISPWVSPLAAIACKRLSWRTSRSVRTGGLFYSPPKPRRWENE